MSDRLMTMPLDELRAERASLQAQDDVISYVRRVAQGRLDVLDAEMARRRGERQDVTGALPKILSAHLTGLTGAYIGQARLDRAQESGRRLLELAEETGGEHERWERHLLGEPNAVLRCLTASRMPRPMASRLAGSASWR